MRMGSLKIGMGHVTTIHIQLHQDSTIVRNNGMKNTGRRVRIQDSGKQKFVYVVLFGSRESKKRMMMQCRASSSNRKEGCIY